MTRWPCLLGRGWRTKAVSLLRPSCLPKTLIETRWLAAGSTATISTATKKKARDRRALFILTA